MKVFISWSGDRSKALAEILRQWLPGVIQAVKPYYSPDDIAKGTRWSSEIAKELEASRVGLICLTPDNLSAPWIMFEAGALSKNLDRSRLCPLLFDVDPSDVEGPLVQFQACRFSREEIERVVRMMNAELGEQALTPGVLDSVFEMWWPKLEAQVAAELARKPLAPSTVRSERELLEEILGLTRSLTRSSRESISHAALEDLDQAYADLLRASDGEEVSDDIKTAVKDLSMPVRHILSRRSALLRRHVGNDDRRVGLKRVGGRIVERGDRAEPEVLPSDDPAGA